jgi:hypothetical protein
LDIVDEDRLKELKKTRFKGVPTFYISAVARIAVDELVEEMWRHVAKDKVLEDKFAVEPPTPKERRAAREKARRRKPTRGRRREWD